jgi:CRISPR/Cas system-associated exonuclease Cas4 (RecB family)
MAVVPTEIKSAAPRPFESINSIQDMLNHRYLYMRKYPAQLQLYLIMDNKEVGVFIFKEKVKAVPKELWVRLDLDYTESLIQKAEAINKHVAEGTLPDPIEYKEDVCGECAFAHICMPDRIGKEVEISDNTELLELLSRYETLKPGAKEFDEVDKRISEIVKGKDKILVGDFFIEGKWQDRTSYDVPAEIKEQYKTVTPCWRKNIMRV